MSEQRSLLECIKNAQQNWDDIHGVYENKAFGLPKGMFDRAYREYFGKENTDNETSFYDSYTGTTFEIFEWPEVE